MRLLDAVDLRRERVRSGVCVCLGWHDYCELLERKYTWAGEGSSEDFLGNFMRIVSDMEGYKEM